MAARAAAVDPPLVPPEDSVAELLPLVYRRVLDAVGRLEELGGRGDAARLRQSAIATYSGAWTTATHRRLEEILARVEGAARDRERRREPLQVA